MRPALLAVTLPVLLAPLVPLAARLAVAAATAAAAVAAAAAGAGAALAAAAICRPREERSSVACQGNSSQCNLTAAAERSRCPPRPPMQPTAVLPLLVLLVLLVPLLLLLLALPAATIKVQ